MNTKFTYLFLMFTIYSFANKKTSDNSFSTPYLELSLISLEQQTCTSEIQPVLKLRNYTPNNPFTALTATIEYQLNDGAIQTLMWEGNLDVYENENVELPSMTGIVGDNQFSAWIVSVNGFAQTPDENNSFTEDYTVYNNFIANGVILTLTTDNYPEETGWELKDQYGNVVYNMPFESYDLDATTYNETLDLASGCYTFTIIDSYGDGICCNEMGGYGSYIVATDLGETIKEGGAYRDYDTFQFVIDNVAGLDKANKISVSVFPNPSSGIFTIRGVLPGSTYKIFNTLGQFVTNGVTIGTQPLIDLSNYNTGIYFLKIINGQSETISKLVKD